MYIIHEQGEKIEQRPLEKRWHRHKWLKFSTEMPRTMGYDRQDVGASENSGLPVQNGSVYRKNDETTICLVKPIWDTSLSDEVNPISNLSPRPIYGRYKHVYPHIVGLRYAVAENLDPAWWPAGGRGQPLDTGPAAQSSKVPSTWFSRKEKDHTRGDE